jgi:hypothetical protein
MQVVRDELIHLLRDVARALQEPVSQEPIARDPARQRSQRQSLLSVIGPLLSVIGIVTVIAGEALGGVTLIVLAVLVVAVVRIVRHRPVASRTRSEPCEDDG